MKRFITHPKINIRSDFDTTVEVFDINSAEAKKYVENDKYTSRYLDYLSENTGEILVDADNDKLIGYIFVGKETDPGFISTLGIKPEYRGKGFSKILLKDAIKKMNAVDLVVDKDNRIALNLYQKFGFQIVKEVENDGNEAYYMHR